MDDLKKQAEELGIAVDGRWSPERLQKEIDEALAKAPQKDPVPEPPKTVDILLKADYWPEEDVRKTAGETIPVLKAKARELINAGKAELALGDDD